MNDQKETPRPPTETIVKIMARMVPEEVIRHFRRQLPPSGAWGTCRFVFDASAPEYDWLVVYHDLHRPAGAPGLEVLRCPRSQTILVTTEPSTITVYGTDYLRQFGTVITSQEPWVISHPRAVFTQPGLIWFYGMPFSGGAIRTYEEMQQAGVSAKTGLLSTVCSMRTGGLTLHTERVRFTERLKSDLPDLDVFGHGVRPMSDKAEALDRYKYHIAVENHVHRHHLTEKLPDAFLGFTLPFYHGCPNAADYFPPESFIPIDIRDYPRTLEVIRGTLANHEYEDRLPYIIEARRRVLEEHNLFAVLERYIRKQPQLTAERMPVGSPGAGCIMTRQTLRIKKPWHGLRGLLEKATVKCRHRLGWRP